MTTPNSITVVALDLIKAAMQEIGSLAPGEIPSNEDQAWVLQKLQRLIDTYNALRTMVFASQFVQFTLVAGLAPHTIGPTGTFQVNQRPVEIPSIGLILTNGSSVEIPLHPRDKDWWAAQSIKGLTSTLPTDYYYEPDWPNGSLFFWPVPTAVNNVLVQSRQVMAELKAYNAAYTMPPGYWNLTVYELAIEIGPSFERPTSQDLRERYQKALRAVESNNISSPRLSSDSPSQTVTAKVRPDFSFLTGLSQ